MLSLCDSKACHIQKPEIKSTIKYCRTSSGPQLCRHQEKGHNKVDKPTWIKYDTQKFNCFHLFDLMLSYSQVVITCSLSTIATCPEQVITSVL